MSSLWSNSLIATRYHFPLGYFKIILIQSELTATPDVAVPWDIDSPLSNLARDILQVIWCLAALVTAQIDCTMLWTLDVFSEWAIWCRVIRLNSDDISRSGLLVYLDRNGDVGVKKFLRHMRTEW